jgi:hypothetical protein
MIGGGSDRRRTPDAVPNRHASPVGRMSSATSPSRDAPTAPPAHPRELAPQAVIAYATRIGRCHGPSQPSQPGASAPTVMTPASPSRTGAVGSLKST